MTPPPSGSGGSAPTITKDKLLVNRRTLKGQLTKYETHIIALAQKDETAITRKTIVDLETRLQYLHGLHQTFNELLNDIDLLITDGAERAANDQERDNFIETLFRVINEYTYFIETWNTNANPPPRRESTDDERRSGATSSHERQIIPDIKLPTIQLPRFDGSYDKWTEFNDIYGTLIHNNENLSNIQKFYYLKSALTGDAVDIIQSVEVSAANYTIAWQLLTERFKNVHLIVNIYIKALFEIPALFRESMSGLRTLHDSVLKNIRCLKALKQPTDQWGTLLVYLVTSKLDLETKREWQQECSKRTELAKFDDLTKFLTQRCAMLESLASDITKPVNTRGNFQSSTNTKPVNTNTRTRLSHVSVERTCVYCQQPMHPLYCCNEFKQFPINKRITEVKKLKLCYNCLGDNHFTNNCNSIRCRRCNGLHHTLLHYDAVSKDTMSTTKRNYNYTRATLSNDNEKPSTSNITTDPISSNQSLTSVTTSEQYDKNQTTLSNVAFTSHSSEILLSTALVNVRDAEGNYQSCRVLLDPGSQSNFISTQTCKRLNLKTFKSSTTFFGVNESASRADYETNIHFNSRTSNYNQTITCIVVGKVTKDIPRQSLDKTKLNLPKNIGLALADPTFDKSQPIDILIGAELYLSLLCIGQINLNNFGLTLQKTKLGWIIGGRYIHNTCPKKSSVSCTATLESLVHKFWEIENIPASKTLNPQEAACEEHFTKNTIRDKDGRFMVKIPFKSGINELGVSRHRAETRFYALERKLNNNQTLKLAYGDFMKEYIALNHMTLVNETLTSINNCYYMPHHPVVKEDSLTTKVRVVFDASALTDRYNSLNELQLTGAVQQDDLYSILLRFRQHRFVMVADIEKMYRQILVHPSDRSYQRILWRDDEQQSIRCYELNTVTYGTTSAPFLATRCLTELANLNKHTYPTESEIIRRDFYVDDLVTGADSVETLRNIKTNLITILDSAKLPLRKWLSNNKHISTADTSDIKFFSLSDTNASKTLGLWWNAHEDILQCATSIKQPQTKPINKRTILSCTAQLFDPLGLFSPAIIIPKLIIQTLWQLKLTWDESVPQEVFSQWNNFLNQIHCITHIKIPRYVFQSNYLHCELHGFADASTRAYGACIYARSVDVDNTVVVRLLTSKSRVAPLKQITLPRLELCAAVLLANLMKTVTSSLTVNFQNIFYWSDSTVTLSWINSDSNRWKTFVANRVADIQNLTKIENWFHVSSPDNPADLISRGVLPQQLQASNLWWFGPEWLNKLQISFPKLKLVTIPDESKKVIALSMTTESFTIVEKYSNFTTLTRVIAYVMRFINNCKSAKGERYKNFLTTKEIQNATMVIIKIVQNQIFSLELKLLVQGKPLPLKSPLNRYSPFVDEHGVIRVGGRLKHSKFTFNKKHPVLLPGKHYVTSLIARQEHIRLLHCGPQELLYSLREQYWPTSGTYLTKKIVRTCVRCFRVSPKLVQPKMGDLPAARLTQIVPFSSCGVDYAGPLNIRDKKGRGYKIIKIYICIFVCFATKAIHLELVDDLTSDAFIACLRRFASRCGKPDNVHSDNATNFVGADAELLRLAEFLKKENSHIAEELATIGINWHFIPPRSPHFGGLWEAAVKSTKHHLKRVLGNSLVTYIELLTIIVQIEAVLNSRPLSLLNNDPNDIQPLTPAHFLIGKNLTALTDTDFSHVPMNRLGAYQLQQSIVQGFWKRWYKEYISTLQARTKWKNDAMAKVNIDDVVLLKDDNLPPLKWKLGRIIELHYGTDGVARVATVHCGNGTMKRALAKLCPLPKEE